MSCIAAFLRDDRIILAADSLAYGYDEHGQPATRTRSKLFTAGKWHFVSGGYQQHAGGYEEIETVIRRAITPTTTIAAAMQALARAVRPHLHEGFRAALNGGRDVNRMHVCWVAGVDGGVLVLGAWKAWLSDPGQPLQMFDQFGTSVDGSLPRDPDGWLMHTGSAVPNGPAITLQPYATRPKWLAKGDAAAAYRLLKLEAAAAPDTVGPPYDVIEITRTGARRVREEELC